jgi:succinate dehydrogenase / fumarate reductase cytochrome b subunit
MVRLYGVLTYRGRAGQWAWVLHRVTGVGVLLFLLVHIVDTAFIGWGPELYNKAMAVYRMPVFRVGEVLLAGCVLFHALNGVRIIILDFWPETTAAHRKWVYAVGVAFAVIFIPTAIIMLEWVVR